MATNAPVTPEPTNAPGIVQSWLSNKRDQVCALLIGAATLVHVAYYFPRIVDDAFISLRYAENFAHGNGAVFNLGERVEGYSSPLWMLLQAAGIYLGIDGVTWTKLLGMASLGLLQAALFICMRQTFRVTSIAAWVPPAFCAMNSYVVNWAVLGLETPLHLALIVCSPVVLERYVQASSRRRFGIAFLAMISLVFVRPEAPIYVASAFVAQVLYAKSRPEAHVLARRLAPLLVALGFSTMALIGIRYSYYGYVVANTYFAKGAHAHFSLLRMSALVGEGSSVAESLVFLGGAVLLGVFGFVKRRLAPFFSVVLCTVFACSVIADWMPSLRHLLPILIYAPVGWALLIDHAIEQSDELRWPRVAMGLTVALLLSSALQLVQVDNRFSASDMRDNRWILPKNAAKIRDLRDAFARRAPPHVRAMGNYETGQITQLWGVLEASDVAPEASWFVGRDIGAVAYLSGVNIFDSGGLVTHSVTHSKEWSEQGIVSDALFAEVLARKPVGGEIYEGWELAMAKHPEVLRHYRIRFSSMQAPHAFVATDRSAPSADEVRKRYARIAAKLPQWFYVHTLYGESLGAVVERRQQFVNENFPATDQ